MASELSEGRVKRGGIKFDARRPLDKAPGNREERNSQKGEKELEDQAKPTAEYKTWGYLRWLNSQPRRISQPDDQPAYSESVKNALDGVSAYSESDLRWKRLWEGYYDRVFLVDQSKNWVERAAGHRFPDKLALASGLYDFAHWQLSDWHIMMLDQMYEADADSQLKDDITRQISTVDVQGPANSQPVQSRGNMPELSGQSSGHLSPQQNPYAQAIQDLRNEPGSFVKFEPEFPWQQSDALSSPEKQRAHFRDSPFYDDDTAWAHMQRRKSTFRAVLASNGSLVLLLFLFLGRITEYW